MSTFTKVQQIDARKAFIEECRQKAWGAACHADWIGDALNTALAEYQKLQATDQQLQADIKESENALDSHTVENRNKRKELEKRRDAIREQSQGIITNAQDGQKAMQQLLQSVEVSIALAKHAEEYEWKETASDEDQQHSSSTTA